MQLSAGLTMAEHEDNPQFPNSPAGSPDYILDLSSAPQPIPPGTNPESPGTDSASPADSRPFLSIHFKCCNIYARIYMTADRTAYSGHCPKCAKPARIGIGPSGTSARFFTAE